MRVLIAGRHELAASVLKEAAGRYELVYVRPRRETPGRGTFASRTAEYLGVTTVQDEGEQPLSGAIDQVKPDVLLSLGYDRIIRSETLNRVGHRANVHFGALPRYRGSLSIPWAMLNGDGRIGITLHDIAGGIDDGPIIEQRSIADDGTRSCRELYDEAVLTGTWLALAWLAALRAGTTPPTRPQTEEDATYFAPEFPNAFEIDWRQTFRQVLHYVRAAHFPPYPSAHSTLSGHRMAFDWPVTAIAGAEGRSGTIIAQQDGLVAVAVLNGAIVPGFVTFGGRRARFADVVAEHKLIGQRFT